MESVLTYHQIKEYRAEWRDEQGNSYRLVATVRFDDCCRNGHNTFSITGDVQCMEKGSGFFREYMGGCCHEIIGKRVPELAPFFKWHLCSTDGPMHYPANVLYFAGDRDCHGLCKGEFRQFKDKKTGFPEWRLKLDYHAYNGSVAAAEKPAPLVVEYEPWGRTGEGKERELKLARESAIWPEATDEELTAPDLKERLEARLPKLLADFRVAVESLGFTW